MPEEFDKYLAIHVGVLANRAAELAGNLEGARNPSRRPRGETSLLRRRRAACAQGRWSGDRRGFDRIDPFNCGTHRHNCAAAAWRRGVAGTRHRSRRGIVAVDCRRREKAALRRRRAIHNLPCRRCFRGSASRRDAVVSLAQPCGRERLVSEALRPAATTELWRAKAADADFGAHSRCRARHDYDDRGRQSRGRGACHRGGAA